MPSGEIIFYYSSGAIKSMACKWHLSRMIKQVSILWLETAAAVTIHYRNYDNGRYALIRHPCISGIKFSAPILRWAWWRQDDSPISHSGMEYTLIFGAALARSGFSNDRYLKLAPLRIYYIYWSNFMPSAHITARCHHGAFHKFS